MPTGLQAKLWHAGTSYTAARARDTSLQAGLLPDLRLCREELSKLGPLSLNEKITAGALGTTVALWIFGGQIGIGSVGAALLGLSVLLITNVTTWKEALGAHAAARSSAFIHSA